MNLRNLSDNQLHVSTVRTAEKQREITLELLNHLNEVERRHMYSKFKCSSLHGYCVQELKMTSGNASHHINAARLIKQVPEIQEKVLSGSIAVTTVASAEAFFKKEARAGNKFDLETKQEILSKLESLATREADKVLLSHASNPEIHFREKVTQKTESIVELKVHLDEETMEMLGRLKEIWSHAMPHAAFADLIKRALKEAIEKNDPLKKIERSGLRAQNSQERRVKERRAEEKTEQGKRSRLKTSRDLKTQDAKMQNTKTQNTKTEELNKTPAQGEKAQTPALGCEATVMTETKSTAITKAEIRRAIWRRDQAQCTFTDPRTGERCEAKHFVEEDHILPKAMGGDYTLENMRLRCRAHNQRHAINVYGQRKMESHFKRRS